MTAKWHHVDGLRSQICAQQGRVSDLIVVAKPSVQGPSSLIEAVTTQTGRPVLIMPREQETFSVDHMAIGWNGSVQVSSAVKASMQTLKSAKKITILSTTDRLESSPGVNDLSDYLAWHGLTADLHVLDNQNDPWVKRYFQMQTNSEWTFWCWVLMLTGISMRCFPAASLNIFYRPLTCRF